MTTDGLNTINNLGMKCSIQGWQSVNEKEEIKKKKKKKYDYHAQSASPLPDHFEDILLAVTKTSSFGTRFRT